jgi:serine/threonine protein kinase/tetratricopeptide (TPR) repeat protein
MSVDPHAAKAIFMTALDKSDPAERAAYLAEACGADEGLRQRVELLLRAHSDPGSFLVSPAAPPAATIDESTAERAGTVIGPYKLLQQIGEGGMGVVWMAEQTQPVQRKVALKVLKPGMDTRQVVARFEAERQVLALMDHPNIARVIDGGQTSSGRPYFVMDLVKGLPISEYCDQAQLAPRERLELFVHLCQAVQHAHQKGIIHRDLKPSNVLVTVNDTTPVVKVIDFGVAKALGQQLTDRTLFTGFAQMIGTPLYMSPEQAGQSGLDVDTRTDVYSLGVLLYELLTGTTPFDKARLEGVGYDELRRIIREEEPARPSTRMSTLAQAATTASANRQSDPKRLTQLLRGELDWIVMKAMEKDRNRRYETASAFAADVQRYLNNEPVQACPASAWYRFGKFSRRNKMGLTVAGLALFFLLSLGGGVGWVVRDRAARQARAANDLELALERAELFVGEGKRAEALAAFERAEQLAAQAPRETARDERLAALKERLAAEARDQEFIARFEDIRLRAGSRVDVEANRFTPAASFPEIRDALRRYGIAIGGMTPAQAAALVQGRPESVRRDLVAALDQCVSWAPQGDSQTRRWLLAALNSADNDPWRTRARQAMVDRDPEALAPLARAAVERKQPPNFLLSVALHLPKQMGSVRLELLRRVRRAYPADFWANYWLAYELMANMQPAEAIHYYTAALALRPDSPGIFLNRGWALDNAGEVDEAIADYHQALVLAPKYSMAHNNLGLALWHKGRNDEAIVECREAIRLHKDFPEAHVNLGLALSAKGRLDDAIAEYRKAIQLKKDLPQAHHNLGNAWKDKGQLDKAMAEWREAIDARPDYAEAHCNLGHALRLQGEFRQALEELRLGHKFGSRNPRWRYPSARWLEQCERLVELDRLLPGFLEGKTTPASPDERIELAGLCSLKRMHCAAAHFYAEAIAAEPKRAHAHRYNAARAAALAGCSQGKDADKLDSKERASLRRQALDWLRADLEAWGRLLDKEPEQARSAARVTTTLQHWLVDPDFAGVRSPEALARDERQPWKQLWGDLAATLARARGKTTPEK